MTSDRYRNAYANPPSAVPVIPVDNGTVRIDGECTISSSVCMRCGNTGELNMGRAWMLVACDCEAGARAVERWKVKAEEQVERVARAIYEAREPFVSDQSSTNRVPWEQATNWHELCRLWARAAIGAMSEK